MDVYCYVILVNLINVSNSVYVDIFLCRLNFLNNSLFYQDFFKTFFDYIILNFYFVIDFFFDFN